MEDGSEGLQISSIVFFVKCFRPSVVNNWRSCVVPHFLFLSYTATHSCPVFRHLLDDNKETRCFLASSSHRQTFSYFPKQC